MRSSKPQTFNLNCGRAEGSFLQKVGLWLFLWIGVSFSACEQPITPPTEVQAIVMVDVPPGIPDMEIEPGNELTLYRVQLGKKLFFDPYLSRDSSISCGSCHHQEKGFADFDPVSVGVDGRLGKRNAPALINLGWHEAYNRDGGTFTLETQMLVPFTDHLEMDMTLPEVAGRIALNKDYAPLFELAYPGRGITPFTITRATAAYERSLVSFNSPYDRYTYFGETNALTPSQIRGLDLFKSSRTNCSGCHSDFNFRSESFENNGLYFDYPDSGRISVTFLPEDRAKFKIPTLRNVEVSGPYMHDGSFSTLREVVDHYAQGGQGHPNQSSLINGFSVSEQEKEDLVNFLMALTDQSFLNNPDLVP